MHQPQGQVLELPKTCRGYKGPRHSERRPVILSAAKDLVPRTRRSFAALRMTGRIACTPAHGRSSLHMSIEPCTSFPPIRSRRCTSETVRQAGRAYQSALQHGKTGVLPYGPPRNRLESGGGGSCIALTQFQVNEQQQHERENGHILSILQWLVAFHFQNTSDPLY